MKIQFNTDKTIDGDNDNQQYFSSLIEEKLSRFDSHISRIEVHLSDKNGKKEGINAIQCLMETRIEGREPIVVTCDANNVQGAVSGAIEKVKASMDTIVGKMQSIAR